MALRDNASKLPSGYFLRSKNLKASGSLTAAGHVRTSLSSSRQLRAQARWSPSLRQETNGPTSGPELTACLNSTPFTRGQKSHKKGKSGEQATGLTLPDPRCGETVGFQASNDEMEENAQSYENQLVRDFIMKVKSVVQLKIYDDGHASSSVLSDHPKVHSIGSGYARGRLPDIKLCPNHLRVGS